MTTGYRSQGQRALHGSQGAIECLNDLAHQILGQGALPQRPTRGPRTLRTTRLCAWRSTNGRGIFAEVCRAQYRHIARPLAVMLCETKDRRQTVVALHRQFHVRFPLCLPRQQSQYPLTDLS